MDLYWLTILKNKQKAATNLPSVLVILVINLNLQNVHFLKNASWSKQIIICLDSYLCPLHLFTFSSLTLVDKRSKHLARIQKSLKNLLIPTLKDSVSISIIKLFSPNHLHISSILTNDSHTICKLGDVSARLLAEGMCALCPRIYRFMSS